MATQTLEFNATQGLTLTAKLFAIGSDTVVQSVSATAKTNDKGRYAAAFTDVPAGRYRLNAFVGANGGFANETYRLVLSTARFYPDSEQNILTEVPPRNLESPERDVADLRPVEFDWPAGATFADGDSTRIFPGQSSTAPLSGAITQVRAGRYSIAYNIADRAADATTIVPTEVLYRLVDDNGNFGDLTLKILPQAASGDIAVLPGRDRAVTDAGASTITVKLNEVITIARAVVDANGQPMDMSGFTNLQFVVQDARGLDLATVDHADITISGADDDTYSFICPIEMTSRLGVFDFSLNQVGGGQMVGGKWIVQRRAVAD